MRAEAWIEHTGTILVFVYQALNFTNLILQAPQPGHDLVPINLGGPDATPEIVALRGLGLGQVAPGERPPLATAYPRRVRC
jgi:hypothetical protein